MLPSFAETELNCEEKTIKEKCSNYIRVLDSGVGGLCVGLKKNLTLVHFEPDRTTDTGRTTREHGEKEEGDP